MKHSPIFEKALTYFGEEAQLDILIEEMSELTQAICKRKRGFDVDAMIIEELVDVEIMLTQIKLLFPSSAINCVRVKKMKRLAATLKKAETKNDK